MLIITKLSIDSNNGDFSNKGHLPNLGGTFSYNKNIAIIHGLMNCERDAATLFFRQT